VYGESVIIYFVYFALHLGNMSDQWIPEDKSKVCHSFILYPLIDMRLIHNVLLIEDTFLYLLGDLSHFYIDILT